MRRGLGGKLLAAAGLLAGLYALFCGFFFWAMSQPPDEFGLIVKQTPKPLMAILPFRPLWKAARAGDLSVGDAAPDFELPKYDKSGMVRLSDFRGSRPVVLVFGSYT